MNDDSPLRHLACVADGVLGAGPGADGVLAAFATAAALLPAAFGAGGDLSVFSWFSPEVRDRVLAGEPAAVEACVEGLRRIRGASAAVGASVRLLGRTDRIPSVLLEAAVPGPDAPGPVVGWFLDYSSRDEILRAAGRLPPIAVPTEEEFSALLDTRGLPDPDLVLYVGGEFEPKDFLLWQSSYAELWHTARPWPAFTVADLSAALEDFRSRQRRFGG